MMALEAVRVHVPPANVCGGCRECFLHEEEYEGALEAFQLARQEAGSDAAKQKAADAFIAATQAALNGTMLFVVVHRILAASSAN